MGIAEGDDLDPFGGELPDGAEGVRIRRRIREDGSSGAYFDALTPRSVRALEGVSAAAFADLQDALRVLQDARNTVDRQVRLCRSFGVSWGAIAWVTGLTDAGARKRFSDGRADL